MDQQPRAWIIARGIEPGGGEDLVAMTDELEAHSVADALGEGHHVRGSLPLLAPGDGHRVVAWWLCTAVAAPGTVVEVAEPVRLAGAEQLLLPGEKPAYVERVLLDEEAAALAEAVRGEQLRYVQAYAQTATRASELAQERARELAEGPWNPA